MASLAELRKLMIVELKRTVVPVLKQNGFQGSFPHFRRKRDDGLDLLTFQFHKWGGSFLIEIARCGPDGFITPWSTHIPADKVNAHNMYVRKRIRPDDHTRPERWFCFDDEPVTSAAESVLPHLPRAEAWWKAQPIELSRGQDAKS